MHAEQANPLAAGKDDVNPLNMVCRHKIQYTKVKSNIIFFLVDATPKPETSPRSAIQSAN